MGRMETFRVGTLAFVLGSAGGTLANLLPLPTVRAQDEPAKLVEAQEFRLVDKNGAPRGYFGFLPDGRVQLGIYNREGKLIWFAPRPEGPRVHPLESGISK